MADQHIAHPPITSKEEWLTARTALLEREKAQTKARDALHADLRRLPMVKVDKEYTFTGPDGAVTLADLFQGHRQLIVYHFMFGPTWEKGCPGCTGYVDEIGDLALLDERDTAFVLVSRAAYAKLADYRAQHGWTIPWYSSYDSDFNYDYQATHDEAVAPTIYNFRPITVPAAEQPGEAQGISVFFRLGDEIYHTYSSYARGCESLTNTYSLLDITPYGRQEDWEDSPAGFPQRPTYG